jgi:hypothetical protein
MLQLDQGPLWRGRLDLSAGGDTSGMDMGFGYWFVGAPYDPDVWIAVSNLTLGTLAGTNAPTIRCLAPLIVECTKGGAVPISLAITSPAGRALEVVWSINSTAYQTNQIPAAARLLSTNVAITVHLPAGTNLVEVTVSDGRTCPAYCSTIMAVADTTPPEIHAVSASPPLLWPPNHEMVPVAISVAASDNCGRVASRIVSVSTSEPPARGIEGDQPADWEITGDLTLKLQAARSGSGPGREYTILIQCQDDSGNKSFGTVVVSVPRDNRRAALAKDDKYAAAKGP